MATDPDNLVLELLRGILGDLKEMRSELTADFQSESTSLRAVFASRFATVIGEIEATREQTVHLSNALIGYHSAVIWNSRSIDRLGARARRIELHLHLPSVAAY